MRNLDKYYKTCWGCNRNYQATRIDQRFCSKSCYQKEYREGVQIRKEAYKEFRCEQANELIELIAYSGRKFFNYEENGGSVGRFELKNGRTYFVDGYTNKSIYAYENHSFGRKFTEGGTLQALVLDLAEFIRTGEPTNAKNGYGGIYCDHWGYPAQDKSKIHQKAKEIGFTAGLDEDLDRRGYIVE